MRQAMTANDTMANQNPLYKKMCSRFLCSGNVTVGEIMLRNADRASTVTPIQENPCVQSAVAPKAKKAAVRCEMPEFLKRRSVVMFCTIFACVVLLLAFIIPFAVNTPFTADTVNAQPLGETVPHFSQTHVQEEPAPTSSFDNVMDALNSFSAG